MKLSACFARKYHFWRYREPIRTPYYECFGGFMAGLPIFIEHANRRLELTLYVLPRALEIVLRLIRYKSFPFLYNLLRSNYFSVFVFQCSMAIWMSLMAIKEGKHTSNKLNMAILRFVFGEQN